MTTDDVIGEFMRSAPYIDGVAETHYLDANAMAAEIVRLRAMIDAVLALPTLDENRYGPTSAGPVGDVQTNGKYVRTDDILDALGVP